MKQREQLPDLIVLCGFMGAGKSTLGRSLANRLALPFLDLDEVIREAAGKSIPQIFNEEGEDYFRELERETVLGLIQTYNGVLALGGGTLQDPSTAEQIKIKGVLIFIETPFSVIFKRLLRNKKRPLLLNKDGSLKDDEILKKELNTLYEVRLPNYRQADITIQTGTEPVVDEITDRLVRKIREYASDY